MKNSLGFYRIEYDNGIVQINELITREDYEIFKNLTQIKSDIQSKMSGKKKKEKDPELLQELNDVNEQLKDFSKPFFVVDSPMYEAIQSGVIHIDEPAGNSGDYPAKIIKVDSSYDDLTFEEESFE